MNKKRKIEYDIIYLNIAETISKLSYAIRNKVGAIIVNEEGQIISQGFNGTPSGYDNCCEDAHCSCQYVRGCAVTEKPIKDQLSVDYCSSIVYGHPCRYLTLTTKKEVLHAESNAIAKCAKLNTSTNNCTIYVTLSPCFECAKLIIQAGIKRVVYKDIYRNTDGLKLLIKSNIICEQLNIENKKLVKFNG